MVNLCEEDCSRGFVLRSVCGSIIIVQTVVFEVTSGSDQSFAIYFMIAYWHKMSITRLLEQLIHDLIVGIM